MAEAITLERIMALQAAYIRCIDGNELERWPEFFADECLYKVTSAENHRAGLESAIIYADTRDMLTDRVLSLRQANVYEKQSYRHILGLPSILKNGGGEAECETPFLVVRIMHDGQSDLFASGVYLDTYRLDGGDLKLARRIAVCDSSRVDTLMALPL
ncbi:MAG: aromatic-ring-hydroxylating dioxygenase subunit beta [Alphaproteobacteria bacterium]|nr:aromatic-ring-hydroxylating dioxygenase subunit beta [Alphaproteobacteria bacterium]